MCVGDFALYDECVLIIWKWQWGESVYPPSSPSSESEDIDDSASTIPDSASENSDITHSIVFKCIGSNRDPKSQDILSQVSQKLESGDAIPVKLDPEPLNPRAIAFVCEVANSWHRIGYVVRECLDSVHYALSNDLVIKTEFSWVKYIVHWSRSGPGWYAGINIVKKGCWPSEVVRAKSTV